MIVEKPLEQMLKEIKFTKCLKYDIISPAKNPELFSSGRYEDGTLTKVPNSEYLESINKVVGGFDVVKILNEILLNSFDWGNKKQEHLPTSLKIFGGSLGYVIRIRDSGKGFNYKEIKFKMDNSKIYWKRGGCGFTIFEEEPFFQISFEGKGDIVNLMVPTY